MIKLKQILNENKIETLWNSVLAKVNKILLKYSPSKLSALVTKILDRLDNLPEVVEARKSNMEEYKLQKLIRSKATKQEKEILRDIINIGDVGSAMISFGNTISTGEGASYKVYHSKVGQRMFDMGFFIQSMTDRYTGNYPNGRSK